MIEASGEVYFVHALENYVGFNMSRLPKSTSRFNTIPVQISAGFFVKIDKLILKFICRIAKGVKKKKSLKGKNNLGVSYYAYSRHIHAVVIKTASYWDQDKDISETEQGLKQRPHIHGQLPFHTQSSTFERQPEEVFGTHAFRSSFSFCADSTINLVSRKPAFLLIKDYPVAVSS